MAGGGGGVELQITLNGEAAQQLRHAFPRSKTSLAKVAEKILLEWLEDQADMKAADAAERRSKGKPTVKAADLYKECGL